MKMKNTQGYCEWCNRFSTDLRRVQIYKWRDELTHGIRMMCKECREATKHEWHLYYPDANEIVKELFESMSGDDLVGVSLCKKYRISVEELIKLEIALQKVLEEAVKNYDWNKLIRGKKK